MGVRHIVVRTALATLTAGAVLLGAAACADGGGNGTGNAGTPETPVAGTTEQRTIAVGSAERDYAVHIPGVVDPEPDLVIALHYWGGTMQEYIDGTSWSKLADAGGFVVAFGSGNDKSWNAGDCCGTAMDGQSNDLGYIDAMIAALKEEFHPGRVLVAGTSNGAMMAQRYGCEGTEDVDVASISGSLFVDCEGAPPRNVIMINGLLDETVRYDGEPGGNGGLIDGIPVPDAFAKWRQIDQCGEPSRADEDGGLVHVDSSECADGKRVELITIDDVKHSWPSSRFDPIARVAEFYRLGG